MNALIVVILLGVAAIIGMLATPQDERGPAATMLIVSIFLYLTVGWVLTAVALFGWLCWRFFRDRRWESNWNRRSELEAAALKRQLTADEIVFLRKQ